MRQLLSSKVSLLCLLILTMLAFNPGRVVATNWVRLQPDEVISYAEVIVQGTYDFTYAQPSTPNNRMWVPFKFNVEKYFKGSGTMVIEAAIEQLDVGWVKQFQEQKGSFVLFLRKDEKTSNLLIPVGGPNGMIQVQDGSFQNIESAYAQQYKDFLANQTQITPIAEEPVPLTKKSIAAKAWPWFLALFTLGVSGLLLVKLSQRKR
jgi:hypothetical protein